MISKKHFEKIALLLILIFSNACSTEESTKDKESEVPIEIDFEITLSDRDAPSKISIKNKTVGASTYKWSFQNGTTTSSAQKDPLDVQYLESGSFEVMLEASNQDESMVLTKTFFLGPVENGIIAHYSFSENANDISGFDNHGIVNGASLALDRNNNSNSAFSFDGVDDFIEVIPSQNLSASTYELSISAWVKIDSFSEDIGNEGIFFIDRAMNNGEASNWGITYRDRWVDPMERRFMGRLFTPGKNNSGGTNTVIGFHSETIPKLNEWYHLAINYNLKASEGEEIHINGKLESFVGNGGNEKEFSVNTASLFIGRQGNGHSFFNGSIDDIRIFNRALDSLEIKYLYNSTN